MPHPQCGTKAASTWLQQLPDHSSDHAIPQQQPDSAAPVSDGPMTAQPPQQHGSDPPGPSATLATAPMSFPVQGVVPQNTPVYTAGQPAVAAQLHSTVLHPAGPPAYPAPMQSWMPPGPFPYQPPHPAPAAAGPWGMPYSYTMAPAPPPTNTYPPVWQPGMMVPPPFMGPWGWAGHPPMPWPGMAAYSSGMPEQPAPAAAAAGHGGQRKASRPKQQRKKQGQTVVQEAANLSDEDEAAADNSDDDWLLEDNQPAADGRTTNITKVIHKVRALTWLHLACFWMQTTASLLHMFCLTNHVMLIPCAHMQVLTAPRPKGSRMRINPTLVKQHARVVAPLGLVLWRQVVAAGKASNNSSNSSGSGAIQINMTPGQIRQQLAGFAAQSDSHMRFTILPDNRNLPSHLIVLCQLLTIHDDPLTITGTELTDRCGVAYCQHRQNALDAIHLPDKLKLSSPVIHLAVLMQDCTMLHPESAAADNHVQQLPVSSTQWLPVVVWSLSDTRCAVLNRKVLHIGANIAAVLSRIYPILPALPSKSVKWEELPQGSLAQDGTVTPSST